MVIQVENPMTGHTEILSMHAFVSDISQADSVQCTKQALGLHILAEYTPEELVETNEHYLSLSKDIRIRIFATNPTAATIFVEAPQTASSLNGRVLATLRTIHNFREAAIEAPKAPKEVKGRGPNIFQNCVERLLVLPDSQERVLLCDEAKRNLHKVFFKRIDAVEEIFQQLTAAALTMNKGPLGMDSYRFFTSKLGMKGFRPCLSDTQRIKFKKDYIGTFKGESHLGEWHATIYDGPNVLSIHFVYSKLDKAILITRIGDHGRTNQDPK